MTARRAEAARWSMIGCMILRLSQPESSSRLPRRLQPATRHRGGPLPGHASSEWTRSYAIQPGGEFQVVGAGGTIDVQGTTNPAIEREGRARGARRD